MLDAIQKLAAGVRIIAGREMDDGLAGHISRRESWSRVVWGTRGGALSTRKYRARY